MVSRGRALLVATSLLIFVFIVSITVAQAASAPGVEWEKTYDIQGDDRGMCVQQTSDGGYIMVGAADNFIYGSQVTGSPRVCLVKADKDGNVEWKKTYDFGRYALGNSVQQTRDGGYILTGSVRYDGQYKVLLVKTDGQGNQVWNKTFGDTMYSDLDGGGYSIRQAADGGYIVAGQYPIAGHYGLYMIKTDPDGNKVWNGTVSMNADIMGPSLDLTSDGGFIVASTIYAYDKPYDYNIFLIKFDNGGNIQWNKQAGGDGFQYCGRGDSVKQTRDGGYIVAGQNGGAYLVKTDGSGNVKWSKQYDNSSRANSVVQADDRGYVLACCDMNGDLQAIKTDSSGNEEWRQTAGYGECEAMSVQKASDGGYIMCGTSGGDLYLVKLKPPEKAPATSPVKTNSLFSGFGDLFGDTASASPATDYGQVVPDGGSLFSFPSFKLFNTVGDVKADTHAETTDDLLSVHSFKIKNIGHGIDMEGFPEMKMPLDKKGWPFN